jgi:hypothetical protein
MASLRVEAGAAAAGSRAGGCHRAGDEYSLIPAVLPGILTAPASDQDLLAYMLAVAAMTVTKLIIHT